MEDNQFSNQYHQLLHQALDALVADYIHQTGKMPGSTTINQLMQWSARRTVPYAPDPDRLLNYTQFLQSIPAQKPA